MFEAPSHASQWYAVRTRSRHEKLVRDQLEKQGIEPLLPTVKRLSQWKDRKKEIEVPKKKGKIRLFKTETLITHYYANQSVNVTLSAEKKILEYTVRVLSSRKESENSD